MHTITGMHLNGLYYDKYFMIMVKATLSVNAVYR